MKEKILRNFEHHAEFSPSASSISVNCPVGTFISFFLPEKDQTEATIEGTIAHDVAENLTNCLLKEVNCEKQAPKEHKGLVLSASQVEEMYKHGLAYAKYNEALIEPYKHLKHSWFTEQRVKASEDNWGTVDFFCVVEYEPGKHGVISNDYKYGIWKSVPAEFNWQTINYNLCIYKQFPKLNIRWFDNHIFQPRNQHESSSMKYTLKELKEFYFPKLEESFKTIRSWLKAGYTKSTLPSELLNQYQKSGDWCTFCPAKKAHCRLLNKDLESECLNMFSEMFEQELGTKKPSEANISKVIDKGVVPIESLTYIAKNNTKLTNFIKAATAYVKQRLLDGEKLPDCMLKSITPSRKWKEDMYTVAAKLEELGVKEPIRIRKDLITISDAEKQVGREALDALDVYRETSPSYSVVERFEDGEDVVEVEEKEIINLLTK